MIEPPMRQSRFIRYFWSTEAAIESLILGCVLTVCVCVFVCVTAMGRSALTDGRHLLQEKFHVGLFFFC